MSDIKYWTPTSIVFSKVIIEASICLEPCVKHIEKHFRTWRHFGKKLRELGALNLSRK